MDEEHARARRLAEAAGEFEGPCRASVVLVHAARASGEAVHDDQGKTTLQGHASEAFPEGRIVDPLARKAPRAKAGNALGHTTFEQAQARGDLGLAGLVIHE